MVCDLGCGCESTEGGGRVGRGSRARLQPWLQPPAWPCLLPRPPPKRLTRGSRHDSGQAPVQAPDTRLRLGSWPGSAQP